MRTIGSNETAHVGGGQPALSNVIAAVGLGVAICTAPVWGSVGALIGLTVLFAKTLED